MKKYIFGDKFFARYDFKNHSAVLEKVSNDIKEKFSSEEPGVLMPFNLTNDEIILYYGYIIKDVIEDIDNLDNLSEHWLAFYKEGDKMDIHNHSDYDYTLMHFISLDINHPRTILVDETTGEEFDTDCIEGQVAVFSGSAKHKVNVLEILNNKPRVVGVFNFNQKKVKNLLEDYVYPGDDNLGDTTPAEGMCVDCSV